MSETTPNAPAFANAMSSPPKRSTAVATAPRTASESAASATTPKPTSSPTASTRSSTSDTTTRAPSEANSRAVAAPMLPAPPVISATFPSSSPTARSIMIRQMKVAIAGGAGGVGSSLAFNLLIRPEPFDVVVLDRRPQKVLSHVMDLEQVLGLGGGRSVRAGEYDDLDQADVVVVCAAEALTENTSRSVYLEGNARIVAAIGERLKDWDGVLIMVTNPVDALCSRLDGDRRKVIGYTLNDTLRLRTAIAQARGVAAERVDAWMLGE